MLPYEQAPMEDNETNTEMIDIPETLIHNVIIMLFYHLFLMLLFS